MIEHDEVLKSINTIHERSGGEKIILHGGEPLMLSKKEIDLFLRTSYEKNGFSAIQTNAYLIDEDIISMFKKYKTGVGISIDGPWSCNALRGSGTAKERKKQTSKILSNIDRLIEEKIIPGIIIVVHKQNAIGDNRETLKEWILSLNKRRITGRLNPCITGNMKYDLTPEEASDFYIDMLNFMMENGIRGWSPYQDVINTLKGEGSVECKFRECDPLATAAATSVMRDGTIGVCLRLYGDGKEYERHNSVTDVRGRVLQKYDCKGCEWWEHCHGGCSSSAIDFDWRNKDRFCLLWKTLFVRISRILSIFGEKKQQKRPPEQVDCDKPISKNNHTDGMEHLDDGWRHLDSM